MQLLPYRQRDTPAHTLQQHSWLSSQRAGPRLRGELQRAPHHVRHGRPRIFKLSSLTPSLITYIIIIT